MPPTANEQTIKQRRKHKRKTDRKGPSKTKRTRKHWPKSRFER